MSGNHVRLFGRFEVSTSSGRTPVGFEARKVQELFCYLLLSKNGRIRRERVADHLWPDIDPVRSKKYLRQALWQLQKATEALDGGGRRILVVNQEWISTAPNVDLWVDVAEFDDVYERLINAPHGELSPALWESLRRAVDLYRGELVEGWYCDWAMHHQDIYRSMLLLMLHKLIADAELTGGWELGLAYARRALQLDGANERVHVGMMRLHCIAGNRTAALRQFDSCVHALREELEVEPEQGTRELHALIRSDRYAGWADLHPPATRSGGNRAGSAQRALLSLGGLRDLNRSLTELQEQVTGHIQALERE